MTHAVIAVLAGAIVNFLAGGVWYSPMLFAKAWMTELNKPQDQFGKMGTAMPVTIVSVLASAALMFLLLQRGGVYGCMTGVKVGAVAGLIAAAAMASGAAFEGRSLKFYLINAGQVALSFTLQGAAIAGVLVLLR